MNTELRGLHPNILAVAPLLEGVVRLLHPYAEGAIHDLKQGKVVAIYNNISKRAVGDPSPVTELGVPIRDFPDVFEPYYKTNWDGTKLKCTSVTVRDEKGAPIGLVCVNFDTSAFEQLQLHMEAFLGLYRQNGLNPIEQFTENWQAQVATFIADFAASNNVAPRALSKQHKYELVSQLYDHGLFNYRDAAAYIAKSLGVSRTTVYNYLKAR